MSEPEHEQLSSVVELMIGAVAVFLIIFLMIVCFYLHIKRSYHVGDYSSPDHHASPFRFIMSHHDHGHAPAVRHGLDPALILALPATVFCQGDFKETGLQCAVCLCELSDGEPARMLPRCSHGFHLECIDMWLHSNNTCPLCRSPVSIDESSLEFPPSPRDRMIGNTGVSLIEILSRVPTSESPLPVSRRGDAIIADTGEAVFVARGIDTGGC